jgi:hypothetical protein
MGRAMIRLAAAIVQAFALVVLTEAARRPFPWLATVPTIYMPLLLVSLYVPVLVMLGVGQLRPRPLAVWAAAAAIVLVALGYHEAARGTFWGNTGLIRQVGLFPDFAFWLFPRFGFWLPVSIGFFIAHALVVDSVDSWSFTPAYRKHFDTAWKLGLQAALATIFVIVFWVILGLGAGLFSLIGLPGFGRLIVHDWFLEPATTLALAMSIQATDVQPALIRGTRGIVLALFSWLLPLLAAILAAFLLTLPFISLRPLFGTHFAAILLLTTAILLIFLINCCYQDGAEERAANRVKRIAASVGAAEILPLAGLAAVAIDLRVQQYGWSVPRIQAALIALVTLCYGIGYVAALWPRGPWLQRLERTNLIAAYFMVGLVLLTHSTLGDPARLMVASQLASLRSGVTPVGRFDFNALHTEGARWGRAALNAMAKQEGPENQQIAKAAREELGQRPVIARPPTTAETAPAITVLPQGRKLPDHLSDDVSNGSASIVLHNCRVQNCVAYYLALAPDTGEALLLIGRSNGVVLRQDATGKWSFLSWLNGDFFCKKMREALEAGQVSTVPHPYPDILIGGERFSLPTPLSACR